MSSSPHNQPSESGSSESNLQFKTENIGHWTKKQEDPFAAQNRKKEAKKQKSAAARKKALPYIIIAAAVVVAGLIVWGVVVLVVGIISHVNNDISVIEGYTNTFQEIYDNNDDGFTERLDAVASRAQEEINNNSNKATDILMAQAFFYANNAYYQRSIDTMNRIDPETLSLNQKLLYYDSLAYSYTWLGEDDLANEYSNKAYEYHQEAGGKGSGGEN